MLKKILTYSKRIIMSFFMLYGYNLLVPAPAIIPINYITLVTITLFNIPALIILITIKILIF